jgi:hypothetical protein
MVLSVVCCNGRPPAPLKKGRRIFINLFKGGRFARKLNDWLLTKNF